MDLNRSVEEKKRKKSICLLTSFISPACPKTLESLPLSLCFSFCPPKESTAIASARSSLKVRFSSLHPIFFFFSSPSSSVFRPSLAISRLILGTLLPGLFLVTVSSSSASSGHVCWPWGDFRPFPPFLPSLSLSVAISSALFLPFEALCFLVWFCCLLLS